jgi:hypothetical protein
MTSIRDPEDGARMGYIGDEGRVIADLVETISPSSCDAPTFRSIERSPNRMRR